MTQLISPTKGRPITYNEIRYFEIIEAVKRVKGSLTQAAWLCGIHKTTFRDWVEQGDDDLKMGNDTILAHLSTGVRKTQAEIVEQLVNESIKNKSNAKFIKWWLSIVFRQDFGMDAAMVEFLLEKAQKLEQSLVKLDNNPIQGRIGYDKVKVD